MTTKAKITFTGLNSSQPRLVTAIEFVSWQQRPMKQMRQVEYTTRLGGSQLVISNVKNESPASSVSAIIAENQTTVAASITALEATLEVMRKNIGTRFTFTDENNIVTERCYIVNMNYNIRAVDGGAKAIATVQMTVMTDTAPVGNK
jgi:hypothetical protein